MAAVNEVCGDGQTSGCEDVARSSWSSFAGLPVAAWGLAFYLAIAAVLALALLGPVELRDPLAALALLLLLAGLLVDVGLLGLQAFVIQAWCKLCLATYVLSALAAVGPAAVVAWRPPAVQRPARTARDAPCARRLGARAARDRGRRARRGKRRSWRARRSARRTCSAHRPRPPPQPGAVASPPAAPAAAATPAAGASAAPVEQDAKYWKQRSEQLQATIDDPRKLEAYFTEKAQREYDTAQPVAIDLTDVTPRGPAAAPVKVVEYSDFLCPFCRNLAGALTQFVPQAGGRVAIYFKNYPLDNTCNAKLTSATHPGACHLALGAVCAQRQGKFEAYHDKVFTTELRNPQPADVVRLAGEAGLDTQAMQACLGDQKAKDTLAAQIAEANRLAVAATPTLYINGKKLPRINDFVAVVDKEARKKGFAPMAPR